MPQKDPARPVITRFAPSPTGYLHIGGARTALFNWLYARGRGGRFLLRIEDTDRARHNEEAVRAILDGLKWLGLDWDGEPVSQYASRERHKDVAHQLLDDGKAYRCFLTPKELTAARDGAREAGARFESPWRDAEPKTYPEQTPYAVRFKAPRDGVTEVDDAIQGKVAFPNAALDDLIVLRSEGGPTYNLAVVVDDHDMGVSHIIRGDDHLNNAARQQQIYEALGWPVPVFAHVPLIHGPDGAKLSKRHGALGVEAYREMGYLPGALANYLLKLGWAHEDDEIISRQDALSWFDLAGVNKAPARLDMGKLKHINAQYIAALDDNAFVALATPFLEKAGVALTDEQRERLHRAAPFLKQRCTTLVDIMIVSEFLFLPQPMELSIKATKPLDKQGARETLAAAFEVLERADRWGAPENLEERLKNLAAARELGFAAVGAPLRAALTAGRPSPAIGEVLYCLGREESLRRIRAQIS